MKNGTASDRRTAGSRQSTATPGGFQYTYTGVLRQSATDQKKSVQRLASVPPSKVPENKRMVPAETKQRHGLTISYQWSAGGKTVHGFMW